MKKLYRQAMEWLYIACIALAATAMVVITIIIPYGVFMRYVVNSAASWPEPAGILMMIVFSFIGGAAAYRANAHITVGTLLNMVSNTNRQRLEFAGDVGMGIIGVFMVKWGVQLVQVVWQNSIAEFPEISAGATPSGERSSTTARIRPRRLATPRTCAGACGTRVSSETRMTSRTWVTGIPNSSRSSAKVRR